MLFAKMFQLPGILCKTCSASGEEVWIVEGLPCPKCGTSASEDLSTFPSHDDEDWQ